MKTEPFTIIRANITQKRVFNSFIRENHEYYTFELVIEGEGKLTIDDFVYDIKVNDIYILPKHHNHKYYACKDNPWRKIFFDVDGPLVEQLLEMYELNGIIHFSDCNPNLYRYFKVIYNQSLYHTLEANLKASVVFHKFIIELHKIISHRRLGLSKEVIRIKTHLDQNLNRNTSLDELARKFHRSKASIISIFKNEMHVTPYDYLLRRRVESAKMLLKNSTMTISAIAYQTNFSDPYYFSNYFKKQTGMSPKSYRELYSEETHNA